MKQKRTMVCTICTAVLPGRMGTAITSDIYEGPVIDITRAWDLRMDGETDVYAKRLFFFSVGAVWKVD